MEQLFNDPYEWFDAWLDEAKANGMPDPNAMCLSTVGEDGMPSSRMVLLKERTRDGFVFYTNLKSHKGRDLRHHPKACLLFYWREFNRQIRVEGNVQHVDDATADAYFATRPRGSQIGAWASNQSQPLVSRQVLLDRTREIEAKYEGMDVPRPPHWSGYKVVPTHMEFWQAGEFRLHDRFTFEPSDGEWVVARLNP